ncbi:MAG: hypothetical protein RR224_01055 [Clostridia bacterium]
MKQLTVLVDMDDTIECLCDAWIACLNSKHGTHVLPDDITSWCMDDAFPTLTKQEIYAPLYDESFWSTVKPKKGAAKYLRRLKEDGHLVLIVTTSSYRALHAKMDDVLFKYFPFIEWDDVIITARKQLISGDVLIDDGVHNLEGGEYLKLLMDAPHNRSYDAQSNCIHRVKDWDEVYSMVSAYANAID